jgi:hypothetical protein
VTACAAQFTATLLEGHKGLAFEVPFDPAARWGIPARALRPGRRGHRVRGSINGLRFESEVVPRARGFFVLIDEKVRTAARLVVGDRAKISIRPWAQSALTPARAKATLQRVRRICLALPNATEKIAWGAPTFRVRNKLFVMFVNNHHGDGRVAIWCHAPPGAQQTLVTAEPRHYFVPPYVGPGGWLGVRLDQGIDWSIVASLIAEAYAQVAPKRFLAANGDRTRTGVARRSRWS